VPISCSDTARWRSRISSSSVLAFLTMDATRLHSISARFVAGPHPRGVHQARYQR